MLLSSFDQRETLHFLPPNIEKGVIIIDLRAEYIVGSQKGVTRMYFVHTLNIRCGGWVKNVEQYGSVQCMHTYYQHSPS